MTVTLAAVYAPIGLQGGLTGSLFREFAFTLAGAVTISGVVALTLFASLILTKERLVVPLKPVLVIWVVVRLAARIYAGGVSQSTKSLGWREAFRAGSDLLR